MFPHLNHLSLRVKDVVICDHPPPVIRGPALLTRDTRGDGRVMVSNVTSHHGPGVRIHDLQTIRANNPLLLSSPSSLFWPPVSPVSAPQPSDCPPPVWGVWDPTERIFCFKTYPEILRQNSSSLSQKRWEWLTIEKCVERWKTILDLIGVEPISDVECQLYKWSRVKSKILLYSITLILSRTS